MAARRPVFGDGDAPSGRLPGRLDRCQRAEEPASLSLALLHRDRDCWGCVAHEYLLRCALRYVTSDEEETLYRRFAPRRFGPRGNRSVHATFLNTRADECPLRRWLAHGTAACFD